MDEGEQVISNVIFNRALIWLAIAILLRGTGVSAWLWGGAGILVAKNVFVSIRVAMMENEL